MIQALDGQERDEYEYIRRVIEIAKKALVMR